MINLNLKKCNGCSACYNVCPKKAIDMLTNSEGFLYPNVDNEKCINCGMCIKVCPLEKEIHNEIYKTFYGWSMNEKVRENSSSGGVFWSLANYVLDNNGVVFGAIYDYKTNDARHIMVDNINDLYLIMKSKYIQSIIGDVYIKVKKELESKKLVLFCGTPCQVNGLYTFLNKKYDNLILVDFVCHGVPSPKVWKYHLFSICDCNKELEYIDFRNKNINAANYSLYIKGDKTNYCKRHNLDNFLRLFLDDIILRNSCYDCMAKGIKRASDITISDFWSAKKYGVQKSEYKKGISLFSIYNPKIYEILKKDKDLYIQELPNDIMINKPSYNDSAPLNEKRESFFSNITKDNYINTSKTFTRCFILKRILSKTKRILKIK